MSREVGSTHRSKERWSKKRKAEAPIHILKGEPPGRLLPEAGVKIRCLEQGREKSPAGMETALKRREGDLLEIRLGPSHEKDRRAFPDHRSSSTGTPSE
jgi:hypothetical protein